MKKKKNQTKKTTNKQTTKTNNCIKSNSLTFTSQNFTEFPLVFLTFTPMLLSLNALLRSTFYLPTVTGTVICSKECISMGGIIRSRQIFHWLHPESQEQANTKQSNSKIFARFFQVITFPHRNILIFTHVSLFIRSFYNFNHTTKESQK